MLNCRQNLSTWGAVACLSVTAVGVTPLNPTAFTMGDYVVLLHGLGRTGRSMSRLERALSRQGYRVINMTRDSRRYPVGPATDRQLDELLARYRTDSRCRVHFVTHSLGAVMLRSYLATHTITNLGRVVMLGPPNRGSEVADALRNNLIYRLLTGPAGQQLGTRPEDAPRHLGPIHCETGIIAGDRSLNPFFSLLIPGPDDGKVAVESTRIEGMKDFEVVHCTHTWIMRDATVISDVLGFLETGRFARNADSSPPGQGQESLFGRP